MSDTLRTIWPNTANRAPQDFGQIYMKIAVEECLALDVNDLTRAGTFLAPSGTPCSVIWTHAAREVFRVDFRLERNLAASGLCVSYKACASGPLSTCRLDLVLVRCHLGGAKHMFKCPGKANGSPCTRRVGKLYLIEERWICRVCGNLTYLARRLHDKRKKALARDPAALDLALRSSDPRQRILGVAALAQALALIKESKTRYSTRFDSSAELHGPRLELVRPTQRLGNGCTVRERH